MSHERRLLIEKIQVYTAIGLCVFLMYCLIWPVVRPDSRDYVAAFFAEGAAGSLVVSAAVFLLLCVFASLVTAYTRPQGAMVAAFAGLAALGMHSEPTRFLINSFEGRFDSLGVSMIVEILVLSVAAWAGTVIVRAIWLRVIKTVSDAGELGTPSLPWLLTGLASPAKDQSRARSLVLRDFLLATIVRALVSTLILGALLNKAVDPERGQVIFAIFAAFCVSSLFVTWSGVFVDCDLSALLASSIVGVGIGVTIIFFEPTPPLSWMVMKSWCHGLPVDWVAAGGCGSLWGRWWALRIIEAGKELKVEDSDVDTDTDMNIKKSGLIERYADIRLIKAVLQDDIAPQSETGDK